eukprot:156298_1
MEFDTSGRESAPIWSVFSTQSEAFKMCKHMKELLNQDLQIFSKEIYYDNVYGKRNYLATNYIHFFKKYKSMKPSDRCYYEVIREGFPCKLYFDIEYETQYNTNINGDELMIIFKQFLIEYITIHLSIPITTCDIIDLESSTAIKFSRHLIILFPTNSVFSNNQQCGIFVRKMCDEIRKLAKNGLYHFSDEILTPKGKQLDKLFIYKSDPKRCHSCDRSLFIDEAVYTKNRCFRILHSSKLKNIHKYGGVFIDYYPKQDRKIKSVTNDLSAFTFKEKLMEFMDTLICAVDVDQDTRIIQYPGLSYSYSLRAQNDLQSGCNASPFVALDVWIKDLICHWSRSTAPWVQGMNRIPMDVASESVLYDAKPNEGKISKWMVFKDSHNVACSITYSVDKNRFCMNIARCHKSNGIYFVVKLKEKVVQQKCFDPDCRTFISPTMDVPCNVLEQTHRAWKQSCDLVETMVIKQQEIKTDEMANDCIMKLSLGPKVEYRSENQDHVRNNEYDSHKHECVEDTSLIAQILFGPFLSTPSDQSCVSLALSDKDTVKKNLNDVFMDNDTETEKQRPKDIKNERTVSHDTNMDFQFDDWDDEFIQQLDNSIQ